MNSYWYQKENTYTIPDRDEDLIQWLFPNVFNKKYNKTTTKTNLEIMEKVKLEVFDIIFCLG